MVIGSNAEKGSSSNNILGDPSKAIANVSLFFCPPDRKFALVCFTASNSNFEIKKSILDNFSNRGALCKVFPAKTSYKEMQSWNPDGFFISNGPGDPASMDYAVNTVKEIIDNENPIFGICLGHQILARACDISTYKLHNGHRGINHPVKNLKSGKSEVTSQNHGFAVSMDEIKESKSLELTHVNLNDETVEGIRVKGKKAFSVQYHPESSPGPHDSRYLFDDFINMIKK